MADEVQPDFRGRVVKVLVDVPDNKWQWWSLDEPVFVTQHGRLFLVGRMTRPVAGQSFWGDAVTAYIPWETVRLYTVEAAEDRLLRKLGGPEVNTIPN